MARLRGWEKKVETGDGQKIMVFVVVVAAILGETVTLALLAPKSLTLALLLSPVGGGLLALSAGLLSAALTSNRAARRLRASDRGISPENLLEGVVWG